MIHFPRGYMRQNTVYPKKYAHGFCFAVLCCGYTLTDFPISIRLTSLALWQSNDCPRPSASKATLMNMDKYFMWIHYERLHNHNKAKHNKTVCIFLGIYCTSMNWQFSENLGVLQLNSCMQFCVNVDFSWSFYWYLNSPLSYIWLGKQYTNRCLSGKLWYLQHNCVGDTIALSMHVFRITGDGHTGPIMRLWHFLWCQPK